MRICRFLQACKKHFCAELEPMQLEAEALLEPSCRPCTAAPDPATAEQKGRGDTTCCERGRHWGLFAIVLSQKGKGITSRLLTIKNCPLPIYFCVLQVGVFNSWVIVWHKNLLEKLNSESTLPHTTVSNNHQLVRGEVFAGNSTCSHASSVLNLLGKRSPPVTQLQWQEGNMHKAAFTCYLRSEKEGSSDSQSPFGQEQQQQPFPTALLQLSSTTVPCLLLPCLRALLIVTKCTFNTYAIEYLSCRGWVHTAMTDHPGSGHLSGSWQLPAASDQIPLISQSCATPHCFTQGIANIKWCLMGPHLQAEQVVMDETGVKGPILALPANKNA